MLRFAVERPISVFMFILGMMVLGAISLDRIPLNFMPALESRRVEILTWYKGASAEEIENQVTSKIEKVISTLPGLVSLTSSTKKDISSIQIKVNDTVNELEFLSSLRERLDGVSLPEGLARPRIIRGQTNSDPLLRFLIQKKNRQISDLSASEMIQQKFNRPLEKIEGVALIGLMGAPEKKVNVEMDPVRLNAYGISMQSIPEIIADKNRLTSAGEIKFKGNLTSLKLGSELKSLEDLGNVTIKVENSKVIRLSDVSVIQATVHESDETIKSNGQSAFLIEIYKEAEANSVAVSQRIKTFLSVDSLLSKEDFEVTILNDQGADIQTAIDNVSSSVVSGGILAALVIFLLIQNGWPTFVISLGIPIALMLTFVFMYFFGIDFNLMSLAGLALGVGMLVDNSTVVLESIHQESAKTPNPRESALRGGNRVFMANAMSTFSSMVVFAPLIFVPGQIGQVFHDVAATICLSLFSSLIVSLLVIPMLCANQDKIVKLIGYKKQTKLTFPKISIPRGIRPQNYIIVLLKKQALSFKLAIKMIFLALSLVIKPVETGFRRFAPHLFAFINKGFLACERALISMIEWTFKNQLKAIVGTSLSIIIGAILISIRGAELFPEDPSDSLRYIVDFPIGIQKQKLNLEVSKIESEIAQISGIARVFSIAGRPTPFQAELLVEFKDIASAKETLAVESILQNRPDLEFRRVKKTIVSEAKALRVEFFNDDFQKITEWTNKITKFVQAHELLSSLEKSQKPDSSEISIEFAPAKLSLFGVDHLAFIGPMRSYLKGLDAGIMSLKGHDLTVALTAKSSFLGDLDRIKYFSIKTSEGLPIYLNQVAEIREVSNVGAVTHRDRRRIGYVEGDLLRTDMAEVSQRLRSFLNENIGQEGESWLITGQEKDRVESQTALIFAIVLSLFVVFLIVASQFESIRQPIIVLIAVPLSALGIGFSLWIFQLNISSLVYVGIIILVGSSVNTSIVMVDFANQLIAEGMEIKAAIIESTKKRMKPILVTTLCNLFGLVPMAFSFGEKGSAMQQPLAVAILGGLFSSTLLTLFIVPLAFTYLSEKNES